MKLIKRKKYLNKLIEAKDINLIKVISGVRRSGKSVLLMQYMDYLLSQKIKKKNIIYINFESAKWDYIKIYNDLYNEILKRIGIKKGEKNKERVYILLDEVQYVERWEKAVNAMLVDLNADIYITGSNAYLLSSEITTLIAGRIYTIDIYPFSFKEFLEASDFTENLNIYEKFDIYLKYGGLPMIPSFKNNEMMIRNYLRDMNAVILKKDIVDRNNIKNPTILDNLLKYISSVIGNLTTPNNISEFMRKEGINITNETVSLYLKMLENAYIIYKANRYNVLGKMILKTQAKYYFIDLGLRNMLLDFVQYNSGSALENIVYIELLRRGYNVNVGKYKDLEIDFIAKKPFDTKYIQVTKTIVDNSVEERETRSLLSINDANEKIIITSDILKNLKIKGIKVINIIDFLLDEEK